MQSANKFEYTIFGLLLFLVILIAIPYGGVEIWWEASFIVFIYIIFIVWVIYDSVKGQNNWQSLQILLPLIVLAIFALFQSLKIWPDNFGEYHAISADPVASWFIAYEVFALIIYIELILRFTLNLKMLKKLINLIIAIGVGSAVFGILRNLFFESLVQSFIPVLKPGIGFGQFINRNHFALLMIMTSGLALSLAFHPGERHKRIFYLGLTSILVTGLVLTSSRGGVIAFMAELLVLLFLHLKNSLNEKNKTHNNYILPQNTNKTLGIFKRIGIAALIITTSILGIIWIGDERLALRFEKELQESQIVKVNDERLPTRYNIWHATINLAAENPIAGIGFGGYKFAISKYFQGTGPLQLEQAHNDYLEFFVSGGLIGLFLGLWFAIMLFKKIRQQVKTSNPELQTIYYGGLGSLAGTAVHSIGDFGLHIPINIIIFMTILAIFIGNFDRRLK